MPLIPTFYLANIPRDYRDRLQDVALEALRETWREKRSSMDELMRYARICRVENVMRPYLESST
jgi:hypothetical protein